MHIPTTIESDDVSNGIASNGLALNSETTILHGIEIREDISFPTYHYLVYSDTDRMTSAQIDDMYAVYFNLVHPDRPSIHYRIYVDKKWIAVTNPQFREIVRFYVQKYCQIA